MTPAEENRSRRFRKSSPENDSRVENLVDPTTKRLAPNDNLWSRRQALQLFGGAIAGASLGLYPTFDRTAVAQTTNPIVLENQQAGSSNWQVGRAGFPVADDTANQIKGYASAASINKGEQINFHVTVNPAQTFTIEVYRMGWYGGKGGRLLKSVGPLDGAPQPAPTPDAATGMIDCDWPVSYTLDVPDTWTSGIYLALLTNAQKYQNYIVFCVRDDGRVADLLYQQSVTTYQAYNNYPSDGTTGKSLYDYNSFGANTSDTGKPRAAKVSFNRPYSQGAGSGNFTFDATWERYFIGWLEQSGYDVTYSTNLDTHANGSQLLDFKGFLSVGHDEYWSKQMYDAAVAARSSGVSLGFFGSNTCYWQVRFEPSATNVANRVMVCYKDASRDPVQGATTTVLWRDPPVNRPEQPLVGIQFTAKLKNNGSGQNFVVTNSSNWVWEGTGFVDGDQVAGIMGYEVDRDFPNYPQPSNTSYTLLARSPVTDNQNKSDIHNSSIYQASSGAWVFASGTNHWSYGLGKSGVADARIKRATANILDRFLQSTSPGGQVPAAPSALSATVASGSQINLQWTDNATNESAYTVERSLDGSTNWTELTSTLPADTTTYSDTGLSAGTTYYYRVKATNQAGGSNYSNVANATPSAAVYVFTEDWQGTDGAAWNRSKWTTDGGTSATLDIRSNQGRMRFENVSGARARAIAIMPNRANTEVLASFLFPSTGAKGYLQIYSRASGNWSDGSPSSAYYVEISNSSSSVGLRKVSSGTITELTNANVGQATTTKQWVRFRVDGSTLMAKVWTDGTPEPASWEIQATDASITNTGVLQLKWQRASSATGAREVFLDDLTVRDMDSSSLPPSAPSDLAATATSASQVDLSWKDNSTKESAYTVERSLDGDSNWTELTSTLPADATTYSDTGLSAGTTYYYRVKATNENGSSGYSNTASATPSEIVYVFTEDWTGIDGAAWNGSKWTADGGTSATVDLLSNQGRMRFENVSGARARAIASMSKRTNTEVLMSFRFSSTASKGYLQVFSRASGNWVSGYPGTAYYVELTNVGTNVGLRKISSGTETQLANASVGQATTAKQWVRFRVEGSTLQAKVWTDGTPEPTSWEIQATDASFSDAGVLQLRWNRSSSATDASEVYLDDLQVRDL